MKYSDCIVCGRLHALTTGQRAEDPCEECLAAFEAYERAYRAELDHAARAAAQLERRRRADCRACGGDGFLLDRSGPCVACSGTGRESGLVLGRSTSFDDRGPACVVCSRPRYVHADSGHPYRQGV